MNTFIRIQSKRTVLFAVVLILSITAADLGFVQTAYCRSNGDTKTLIISTISGKMYKVSVDLTGNFTSPKLPKGTYTISVITTKTNSEPNKTYPSAKNSNTNKTNDNQVAETTSHITFSNTKGMIIFVGGKQATGKITLTGRETATIEFGRSGTVLSGTLD